MSDQPRTVRRRSTVSRLRSLDPQSTGPVRAVGLLAAGQGLARLVALLALAHLVPALLGPALLVPALLGGDPRTGVDEAAGVLAAAVAGAAVLGLEARLVAARAAAASRRRLTAGLLLRTAQQGGTPPEHLATTLGAGLDRVDGVLVEEWPVTVQALVVPAATVAALAVLDWRSALATAALLPLLPLLGAVVGHGTTVRVRAAWTDMSRLGAYFLDSVAGLVSLKLAGRTDDRTARIAAASEQHRRLSLAVLRLAFLSSTATSMVATLAVGLVAVLCGTRLALGELDLTTALAAILLAPEVFRPVNELGARFHLDVETRTALDDLEALLPAAPPAAPGAAGADAAGRVLAGGTAGVTALRDVSLTYPGRRQPALTSTEAVVRVGAVTALEGPSGAGKSTVLRLLAGTLRPSSGQVEVGEPVGYLPQHPRFPLAGTVADAVRAGRGDLDDAAVRTALRLACADELAEPRAGGLLRPLLGPGEALSAGERQRLGLARAYAGARGPAPVLLLDEPTAHLDAATEQAVLDRLRSFARERSATVLMAAHRPAAVAAADHHLVLPASNRSEAPPAGPEGDPARSSEHPAPAEQESPGRRPAGVLPAPTGAREAAAADPTSDPSRGAGRTPVLAVLVGIGAAAAGSGITAAAAVLLVLAADQPPLLTLSVPIVLVRLLALSRPLLRYGERLLTHDAALAGLTELRTSTWRQLVPRVPGVGVPARGDLLTRLARDVDDQVEGTIRGRYAGLVLLGSTALSVLVVALLHPPAALPLAGLGCVAAAWTVLRDRFVGAPALRELQDRRAAHQGAAVEVLTALDDVVGNADPHRPGELLAPHVVGLTRAVQRLRRVDAVTDAVVGVLAGLLPMVVAATLLTTTTPVPAGVAAALVLGMVPLGLELTALPGVLRALRLRTQAAARIADVATASPTSVDPAVPGGRPVRGGELALDRVTAAWQPGWAQPGSGQPGQLVLDELSLALPSGGRVALTGASGSGKSTVAALVLHLLDPTTGVLTLAEQDYRRITGAAVRRAVGAAGIGDHVFADTVRANLTLGEPGVSTAQVRTGLQRVQLLPWLDGLPDGLDTVLSSGGTDLSGGEARRLCLARALLRHPSVLVLDEPTESLDPATARTVLADLAAAGGPESWLLLTHRTEGLDLVDDTFHLHRGRLSRAAAAQPS